MIRALKPEEVALCVEGGKLFFAEGKVPGGFDPDVFIENGERLIEEERGVILGAFEGDQIVGALCGVLCQSFFSTAWLAVENFWYVLPDKRGQGIRLLDAYERWAEGAGADFISMIHLEALQPEALGKLYVRRGYHLVEKNFLKRIKKV